MAFQTDLQYLPVQHSGGTTEYYYSQKKKKCVVHISGVHGVEGHLGSLVQQELLKQKLAHLPFQVVIVHTVNPFGKDNFLRNNRNNVDLNRNSLDEYRIENPHFESFRRFFKSGNWLDAGPVASLIIRQGLRKAVVTAACGQTEYPDSLFFAGHQLQPELVSLRETLQKLIDPQTELYVLDIHSGLGKRGQESLIIDGFNSDEEAGFFEKTFQQSVVWPGKTAGTYQAAGTLSQLLKRHWKCFHVFQEFGTYRPVQVLKALIHRNPNQMLETFFPNDLAWRSSCVQLGLQRFQQLSETLSQLPEVGSKATNWPENSAQISVLTRT
jgi:hypothetical protein